MGSGSMGSGSMGSGSRGSGSSSSRQDPPNRFDPETGEPLNPHDPSDRFDPETGKLLIRNDALVYGSPGEVASASQVAASMFVTDETCQQLRVGEKILIKRSNGSWTWAVAQIIERDDAAVTNVVCTVNEDGATKPIGPAFWGQYLRSFRGR